MGVNCPHCQALLGQDARFCPACGTAVQATTPEPAASGPLRQQVEMIGREIAGRFRILALLGEGGMGAVYRGEQMSLKRAVAVKLLRPELSANQMLLRRFSAEAAAVAKLDHPNTVKVYDFGQDTDGSLFIAMELIEGQPLRAVIGAAGPLPPARAFNIAIQVAASLVDAHASQIVHRDLKPDNVMLIDKGKQRDIVRVLDFGIAKLRDDSRATQQAMTQAGDMLGTPQYMAPEQIKGEAIDGRTDIYALGCMIYEMVTARLPFEAPSIMAMLSKHLIEMPLPPSQRRPDLQISPAIDQVVMAALHKDPAARPANMEHYADLLARVLSTLPQDPTVQLHHGGTPAPMPVVATPAGPTAPLPVAQTASTGAAHYGAPTPAPYVPYPAPQQYPPPPYAHARPPAASKMSAIMIVGVLFLGGAAVGVYFATHKDTPAHVGDKPVDKPVDKPSDKLVDPPAKDPWATDPWATEGALQRPPPPVTEPSSSDDVGTAATPIPDGAHLDPPSGFEQVPNKAGWQMYASHKTRVLMILGSLYPGTNDPKELAEKWIADNADLALTFGGVTQVGYHQMATFTGKYNGEYITQYMTFFITARYRIAYIVQAPVAQTTDWAQVSTLIATGVTVP
jgi:tRNA A-37 threonylcarbamoyl transferase component Bud32